VRASLPRQRTPVKRGSTPAPTTSLTLLPWSSSVLVDEFGQEVASLVEQLTDISTSADGDREARKSIDRAHTALATAQAQDIKIADIADNTQSIVDLDPEFAVIYLTEKQRQLEVLGEGCQELMAIAKGYVEYGLSRLAAT